MSLDQMKEERDRLIEKDIGDPGLSEYDREWLDAILKTIPVMENMAKSIIDAFDDLGIDIGLK